MAFEPTTSGPLAGKLTFGDNNLNVAGATQQVALAGTGLPPAPTITGLPGNEQQVTADAVYVLTDSASTVTGYLCNLDGAPYTACSSGISYASPSVGNHTFSVEAQDSFGNTSAATSVTWLQAPNVTMPPPVLTSMPANPTTATSATFTFTDAEPGAQYFCIMDTTFGVCNSGVSYSSLALGSHTFGILASDAYGNSSTETSYTWNIIAAFPQTPLPNDDGGQSSGSEADPAELIKPRWRSRQSAFPSYGTGTIGSVAALTHGAPNLDFALASGGTCAAGATYSAASTCTVNATFTPTLAGYRRGAVVIQDTGGTTLAIAYLQGVGTGPQVSFLPGIVSTFANRNGCDGICGRLYGVGDVGGWSGESLSPELVRDDGDGDSGRLSHGSSCTMPSTRIGV